MALVVIFDFLQNLFFRLIVHFAHKLVVETHGAVLKFHVFDPVEKPLLGNLEILAIDMEGIGLPVQPSQFYVFACL